MSVYEGHGVTLHHGDCLDVLRSLRNDWANRKESTWIDQL